MKTEYSLEVTAITLVIVLAFIAFSSLFKSKIESAEVRHEYKFINGMRGLAAIFVFINHAPFVLSNIGITNTVFSSWGQLYPNLGSFGVQIFFCITGFLFFDKIIKTEKIDWTDFFISRIKRVAPLYYAASLLVLLIAASFSGFQIFDKESLITLSGLISFNFIDNPMKIGGVSLVPLSSVTWTLVHEWRFYAVLPLVAIFYRSRYKALIMIIAMTVAAIDLGSSAIVCWVYFLSGIAAASIHKITVTSRIIKFTASLIAISIFSLTCGLVEVQGYGALRFVLTTIFFICITISNPSFLHYQFLNRMSDISYSIYLLHLPILFLAFKAASIFVDLSSIDKITFWAINFATIPAIVAVSTFTFVNIEKRFMQKARIAQTNANLIYTRSLHTTATPSRLLDRQ
ncbi:acyltransferase family protein [Pseudomonas chlororaphis]|uniref:acyltransferase family protein n=1 Tax=Pseudomonas chlororaphis TaxID=587753 RepID=UPI002368BC2E|nr:acyltransferase [Pseudomonas chlororaphis]WDH37436.1 acyltransferase [Pseudomonas chlororaphis]WDH43523.1 acyltransferase [Pseudomonas chlororaphis]